MTSPQREQVARRMKSIYDTVRPHARAVHDTSLKRIESLDTLVSAGFMIPVLVLLAVLFFYPIVVFLKQSLFDPDLTWSNYLEIFRVPVYLRVLWVTIETSGLTTVICLVLGYPVAYLLSTTTVRRRNALFAVVLIPFWTNILVRLYGWMILLGRAGVINELLQQTHVTSHPEQMLFNEFGVLVGMVQYMLPFMILALYSVMSSIPDDVLQAANTLGAGPYRTFCRVYFPLSLPGIGAGCILVFIISSGFFVTPALLGGPQNTMISQLIQQAVSQTFQWGFAAALSVVLLAIGLLFYIAYEQFISTEKIYGAS